jgi:NADP-dependent 3-hydroxy acid dehydrogenase YdfG
VVPAARNTARLQADAARLRAQGIEATTVQVDANDARSVANVVTGIGPELDALHYNGGIADETDVGAEAPNID